MNSPDEYPNLVQYPKTTLYRHAKIPLIDDRVDKRKQNKGRRKLITPRDKNAIKRNISILRETHGTFTSINLQQSVGLSEKMSNSTFRRGLNSMGYKWRNYLSLWAKLRIFSCLT